MKKVHTNIYIDINVRNQCQIQGINMSQFCNSALKTMLDMNGKNKEEAELITRKNELKSILEKVSHEMSAIDSSLEHIQHIHEEAEIRKKKELEKMNNIMIDTLRNNMSELI